MSVPSSSSGARLVSVDQFRGYTVFGMMLVNYCGKFECMPWQFKHHNIGMSYADTIAPLFVFIVGMGVRMSFLRRQEKEGTRAALLYGLRRFLVLAAVGIVFYGPHADSWRWWWDALVDIALSGILCLPFILCPTWVRVLAAGVYWTAYQVIFLNGYEGWVMSQSINGGPAGVLSWAPILLFGTLCYDLVAAGDRRKLVLHCLAWGILLLAVGWALKLPWPGIKEHWYFSQRAMSIPYPIVATGLAFLTYLPFHWICDVKGWRIPHFSVLGMNALVMYMIHLALIEMHGSFVFPRESGLLLASLSFLAFYFANYAVAWKLAKDGVVIKI
jgi:predicted acyltransferase